jgi:hypothetical protein
MEVGAYFGSVRGVGRERETEGWARRARVAHEVGERCGNQLSQTLLRRIHIPGIHHAEHEQPKAQHAKLKEEKKRTGQHEQPKALHVIFSLIDQRLGDKGEF